MLFSRNDLVKYLIELAIIIFGITLSFLLNEYRVENANRKTEVELLKGIQEDLLQDYKLISTEKLLLEKQLQVMGFIAQVSMENKAIPADSAMKAFQSFLTYSTFIPNNSSYLQSKEQQQQIISNNTLYKEISILYLQTYGLLLEHIHIEKEMVLKNYTPYFLKDPVLSLNPAKKQKLATEFIKKTKDNAFINLYFYSLSFKHQLVTVNSKTLIEISTLLKKIAAEIEVLS